MKKIYLFFTSQKSVKKMRFLEFDPISAFVLLFVIVLYKYYANIAVIFCYMLLKPHRRNLVLFSSVEPSGSYPSASDTLKQWTVMISNGDSRYAFM